MKRNQRKWKTFNLRIYHSEAVDCSQRCIATVTIAIKSPHEKYGYFLSISQQGVSADIIQNSAVGNFSPKTEGTKKKAARCR